MAYIYKIVNDINTNVYVGLTYTSIQERWRIHIQDSKKESINRPLYNAIKKYGIEHFSIQEIEKCDDEKAPEREIYWIKELNSYNNGYNATLGGEGRPEYDYNEICKLFKEGYSGVEISKKFNCDINVITRALKSQNIDSNTIMWQRNQKKFGKRCSCFSIKGEHIQDFNSLSAAAEWLILNNKTTSKNKAKTGSHIGDVCRNKRKTAYGYVWKYINGEDN